MTLQKLQIDSLTIRVYGILIQHFKGVLVSDEFAKGMSFTKFPGGGLELGEGIHECLIREWQEELHLKIKIIRHFYTTEFFQISAFNPTQQVISVYFLVAIPVGSIIRTVAHQVDPGTGTEPGQSFRWVLKEDFSEEMVTFPIDKKVAKMICDQWPSIGAMNHLM